MSLKIGTSGWYYDEWVGPFYDRKKGMFAAYTKVFDTAEVNSTFYSYPRLQMVEGWERNSPDGFTFALKLPVSISLVIASVVGAAVGGHGLPLRHLVEGTLGYLDALLIIATAMQEIQYRI